MASSNTAHLVIDEATIIIRQQLALDKPDYECIREQARLISQYASGCIKPKL